MNIHPTGQRQTRLLPGSTRWPLLAIMLISMATHASTRDEIAALEASKQTLGAARQPAPPYQPPFVLSDGRRVQLKEWKVVLFMQSGCSYCQQFDPVLKQISEQTGLGVFPYTLDGQGDIAFPSALPATPDVMVEFFSNGLPIATPTTFLVNVNSMVTYPLFQGAVDKAGFIARLDEVFQIALDREVTP